MEDELEAGKVRLICLVSGFELRTELGIKFWLKGGIEERMGMK